jgi:hypothetical protein
MASKRPPIGINPNISVPVQRDLRKVAQVAFDAQSKAEEAQAGLAGKLGSSQEDLLAVSKFVSQQVQAGGAYPISLMSLPGAASQVVINVNKQTGAITIKAGAGVTVATTTGAITISLPNVGPGAGTYTVGAKLTGGGTNGTITIDAQGRITAITQAT